MDVKGPTGPSKTGKADKSKKSKGSSSAAGAFASFLDGAGESGANAGTSSLAATTPLDAILAMQGIDPDEARKARGQEVRRGFDLLESLDDIRIGLLTGTISGVHLKRLQDLIETQRAQIDDPKLLDIIDDIDLRAAIELAKFERDK